MDNSCKQGDLPPKTFGEVIGRAIDRDGTNRCAIAKKWKSTPENLWRWENNPSQSPKFLDLMQMIKGMNKEERADVATVLFGPTEDAAKLEADRTAKIELISQIRQLADRLSSMI